MIYHVKGGCPAPVLLVAACFPATEVFVPPLPDHEHGQSVVLILEVGTDRPPVASIVEPGGRLDRGLAGDRDGSFGALAMYYPCDIGGRKVGESVAVSRAPVEGGEPFFAPIVEYTFREGDREWTRSERRHEDFVPVAGFGERFDAASCEADWCGRSFPIETESIRLPDGVHRIRFAEPVDGRTALISGAGFGPDGDVYSVDLEAQTWAEIALPHGRFIQAVADPDGSRIWMFGDEPDPSVVPVANATIAGMPLPPRPWFYGRTWAAARRARGKLELFTTTGTVVETFDGDRWSVSRIEGKEPFARDERGSFVESGDVGGIVVDGESLAIVGGVDFGIIRGRNVIAHVEIARIGPMIHPITTPPWGDVDFVPTAVAVSPIYGLVAGTLDGRLVAKGDPWVSLPVRPGDEAISAIAVTDDGLLIGRNGVIERWVDGGPRCRAGGEGRYAAAIRRIPGRHAFLAVERPWANLDLDQAVRLITLD